MLALAVVLLLVAVLGIVLGLIKPGIVIWWGNNKTRGKALLTYGIVFIAGVVLLVIGAPEGLEAGKTALARGDYNAAVTRLASVKPSDQGYAEAQQLLPGATEKLALSKLKAAEAANAAGDPAKVVALLTGYPSNLPGSADAEKMLEQAQKAVAAADRERTEQAAQRAAQAQADKAQREAQQQQEKAARQQARDIADFPECGSDEAIKNVSHTMENAPLRRVYGLSLIKISKPQQVSVSPAARNCTGTALLNNAQSYPITYRFYRDGKDIMIEAEVKGIDSDE